MKEDIKAAGVLTFELTDEFGNVKVHEEHNLVVSGGLAYIASRMKDTAAAVMSHMAIGTNNTAAVAANTTLGAEVARVALTSTALVTTTVANDAIQFVATFNAGVGTGAITEAGLFNAGSAGTMLSRSVFAVINKGALDALTVTWKITILP